MLLLPPISTRTDTPLPYTPLFRSPSACANVAHRRPKKPGNAGLFRLSSRSPPLLLLLYRFHGSPACRALAPHRDALARRTARPAHDRPVAPAHHELAGAPPPAALQPQLEHLHTRRPPPPPALPSASPLPHP